MVFRSVCERSKIIAYLNGYQIINFYQNLEFFSVMCLELPKVIKNVAKNNHCSKQIGCPVPIYTAYNGIRTHDYVLGMYI